MSDFFCAYCGGKVDLPMDFCNKHAPVVETAQEMINDLRAQLAASESRVKELEQNKRDVFDHFQERAVKAEAQLATIRPTFEKLVEYAKKEEDSWSSMPDTIGTDAFKYLRREALRLAEGVKKN